MVVQLRGCLERPRLPGLAVCLVLPLVLLAGCGGGGEGGSESSGATVEYYDPETRLLKKAEGVKQRFVGLVFDGPPLQGSNDEKWRLEIDGQDLGFVTSAVYSPRLEQNIALAMIRADQAADGTTGRVHLPDGARGFTLVPKPFYDPKKALAARS